jgi:hypothetical protein
MWLYRRIVWWYLAAPVFLFLLRWYNHAIGFPLFCALLFLVDHVSRYSDLKNGDGTPYRYKVNVRLMIPTALLTILVAWGGLGANYYDWQKHRALFYDLTMCDWPVGYVWWDLEYLMSYYLMYYLPPAAVASLLGLQWLHHVVEVWTVFGYGLVFFGFFSRSRTLAEWLLLCFVLFAFAGWDVVGWRWRHWEWPAFPEHLVQWNGLETGSNLSIFFWVPQHAIAAWLSGMLLFQPQLSSAQRARFGALLLALVAHWSPLVAVGLCFFVALDAVYALKEHRFNPFPVIRSNAPMLLMSLALVAPFYLYLTRDMSNVYHTWTFYNWDEFVPYYLGFFFATVFILFLSVYLLAGVRNDERYLNLCAVILLLSPLYCFGTVNDLAMRGPMVAYFFLLWTASGGALELWRGFAADGVGCDRRLARASVALAVLLVSMVTTVNEAYWPALAIKEGRWFSPVKGGILGLYREDDARYQYLSRITREKTALMEPITLCFPPDP